MTQSRESERDLRVEDALGVVRRRGRRRRRLRRLALGATPLAVSALVAGLFFGLHTWGPHHRELTPVVTVQGTWETSMHGHFHDAENIGPGVDLTGRWLLLLDRTGGTLRAPDGTVEVTVTRTAGATTWQAVGPAGACAGTTGRYRFVRDGGRLHGILESDRCLLRARLLEATYHAEQP